MKKRMAIIFCVLITIMVVAGALVDNYFYNYALNPTANREKLFPKDDDTADPGNKEHHALEMAHNEHWWLEQDRYSNITMATFDHITLHSYLVQQEKPSNKWVIAVHGYTGKAEDMKGAARHFYSMGYNVLMPNCRGHGYSGGNYIGMGWHDRLDIVHWIQRLITDYGPDIEIVLYGVSMGGATVMMTAGEALPHQVKAIVEDCGYTSAWDEFSYQLKQVFHLPSFPVMQCASIVTRLRAGYSFKEASAIEQLQKATVPIFFIHGNSDTFVPTEMVYKLYDATPTEKELWIVENAKHGMSALEAPEEYWSRVKTFVEKYVTE